MSVAIEEPSPKIANTDTKLENVIKRSVNLKRESNLLKAETKKRTDEIKEDLKELISELGKVSAEEKRKIRNAIDHLAMTQEEHAEQEAAEQEYKDGIQDILDRIGVDFASFGLGAAAITRARP